ncbi:MAG: pyruvate, phosphate dikinase [Rickettsiales bacterium]
MAEKWTYVFGNGSAEGNASMRNLLGGKGANLAEMCNIGLPVPYGFTITTSACVHYYENGENLPKDLVNQVNNSIAKIESELGLRFGDKTNPLLVSVRSGARVSMPGMMDTVLNLGLNDDTVQGLAAKGGKRFAYDSYRRFIQMYSDVVLDVDHHLFEEAIETVKMDKSVTNDSELDADDLYELVNRFKAIVKEETDQEFPQIASKQLWGAIEAVFKSWMCHRAKVYRRINKIPEEWGTAVNVQSMVFGNLGETSATGVAFTRNPSTGDANIYGEYLINAQGEDVVAGIRTPQPISEKNKIETQSDLLSMEETMPEIYQEFIKMAQILESHYRDMQDIEFTVQDKKLWMLQTRSGKRTAAAAIKIAYDLVSEGLISEKEALLKIEPESLDQLLHPALDPKAKKVIIAKGLPASPGAATGKVVFTANDAERMHVNGEKVILVRVETSPEDIHGMNAAQGILTARGGMTSHAAVVARGMGRACVAGAGKITVNQNNGYMVCENGTKIHAGEHITIDGSLGEVYEGNIPTTLPTLTKDFLTIMSWADRYKKLQVRTNAETSLDVSTAIKFGAEGIGLCRTEHMFFDSERILSVRKMIIASQSEQRREALDEILPMQKQDFYEIFQLMKNKPVNIRLLDPPLHEFLPHTDEEIETLAQATDMDVSYIRDRCEKLHEANPMLGHRGARLGISYPEIYKMQSQAIFEAYVDVSKKYDFKPNIEIMVPLISTEKEIKIMRDLIIEVKDAVEKESNHKIECSVGTMIELPRAALISDKIAHHVDYFSYGTNDLTQTSYGMSRDDSSEFITKYLDDKIMEDDPFVSLDQEGVGELIKISASKARSVKAEFKLGICGEHGGDPRSIEFCHKQNLTYVSCSPFRIPIARLAAAHAAIK